MPQCFISHATTDRAFVEKELVGLLEAVGLEPWYAEVDIRTGEDWQHSIGKGLESTDWFILVLSPRSAKSEWVKDEVAWAISHRRGRIIPILIEPCEAGDFHLSLPRIQCVDFTADSNEARNRLIKLLVDSVHGLTVRSTAISGSWNGVGHQEESPDGKPIEAPVNLALRTERKSILGEFQVVVPDRVKPPKDGAGPVVLDFSVTGGLMYERFIQLNYLADDPAVVRFGAMILELDAKGKDMKGKIIGFGAYAQKILTATMTLAKSE